MKIDLLGICFIIAGAVGVLTVKTYFGDLFGGLFIMIIGGLFGYDCYREIKGNKKKELENE